MFAWLVVGGGMMAVASMVPWVSASSVGIFQTFADLTGIDLGAGWVALVSGLLACLLGLVGRRHSPGTVGTVAVTLGAVGLVTYAVYAVLPAVRPDMQRAAIDVYDYFGTFYHAWGLALGFLGSLITVSTGTRIRAAG